MVVDLAGTDKVMSKMYQQLEDSIILIQQAMLKISLN
jgi:hypothetical protein